jgi:hypothetical protein
MADLRLTLALAIALLATQAGGAEVCQLDRLAAPDSIQTFEAVVVGSASEAEVLAETRIAIFRARAPVSPAYVKLPRIFAIFRDAQGRPHQTIAAVLSGPLPQRNAHVTLAARHRDPNQPCAFIPWTVVGPADAAETPPPHFS